jgi:hypothetical protein
MLKLKDGVTGFIYDSCHGMVTKVFTQPLTQDKIETIWEVIDEDEVLFMDNETINNMFEFTVEEGKTVQFSEEEGLGLAIEWIN